MSDNKLLPINEWDNGISSHPANFKRKRNLQLAVSTSIVSKFANIAVQVLAMPVAMHALGVSRFGVYTSLAAVISWLGVSQLGISPGLTRKIAEAAARDDKKLETELISSAFFLMLVIIMPITIISLFLIWLGDPIFIFGSKFKPFDLEIRQGLTVLLIIFTLKILLCIGEAAQSGYQEQFITNAWGTAGNIICLLSLFFITRYLPTILGVILAVNGALLLAQIGNFSYLVLRKRPHLLPSYFSYNRSLIKGIMGLGIAYSLVQLSGILSYDFCILLAGRIHGPAASAKIAIMIQIITLGMGLVAMISQPLWPAITDAVTRNEYLWVKRIYLRTIKIIMIYACIVGCLIGFGGNLIVTYWFGPKVAPPLGLHLLIGLDFILEVWVHMHFIFLIGVGRIKNASIYIIIRGILTLPVALYTIPKFGIPGVGVALVLPLILLTTWTLPHELNSALNRSPKTAV